MNNYSYEYLYDLRINKKLSTKKIAEILGIPKEKAYRKLSSLGIPMKNPNSLVPELGNKEFLYDLYTNKKMSKEDIADKLGTTIFYVRKAFNSLGIATRTPHESDLVIHEKRREKYYNPDLDNHEVIYDLWVTKDMSVDEMSKYLKVPKRAVKRAISKQKVSKLQRREIDFVDKKLPEDFKDKAKLEELYIKQGKSLSELSRDYGVTVKTVKKALDRFGIPRRTQVEAAKLLCGEKSPHWKGVSPIYERLRAYSRDNIHKKVLERDNHVCQMDGCGNTKNLHVHHKIPLWKIYNEILNEHPELDVNNPEQAEELLRIMKSDHRVNDLDNLITYCEDCHLFKVHGYTRKQIEELRSKTGQDFLKDD